jgi:hypothetical protein
MSLGKCEACTWFFFFSVEMWLELEVFDVNQAARRWLPKMLSVDTQIQEFQLRLKEATSCFMVRTLDTI